MIKYKHESTFKERTRMQGFFSRNCSGRSLHRDAELVRRAVSRDLAVMGDFLLFLKSTGLFSQSAGYELFNRWVHMNEATWMREWKEWSKNLERSE